MMINKKLILSFLLIPALLLGCSAQQGDNLTSRTIEIPVETQVKNPSKPKPEEKKELGGFEEPQEPKIQKAVFGISFIEKEIGYENLMLINKDNKIPDDFLPDLINLQGGHKFDRKAAAYLIEMITAAGEDGINLFIVSAYRSNERQTRNFNNQLENLKASGLSEKEAYELTSRYIAPPGCSEHTTGLAVDINSLAESFEQTKEFEWLHSHCAEYGFILRYPKNKEEITKIAYEPWHYRYVGKDHAKKIMEGNLTLEEYLDTLK